MSVRVLAAGEGITLKDGDSVVFDRVLNIICCDCGLAHRFEFKQLTRNGTPDKLALTSWRDEETTQRTREQRSRAT